MNCNENDTENSNRLLTVLRPEGDTPLTRCTHVGPVRKGIGLQFGECRVGIRLAFMLRQIYTSCSVITIIIQFEFCHALFKMMKNSSRAMVFFLFYFSRFNTKFEFSIFGDWIYNSHEPCIYHNYSSTPAPQPMYPFAHLLFVCRLSSNISFCRLTAKLIRGH